MKREFIEVLQFTEKADGSAIMQYKLSENAIKLFKKEAIKRKVKFSNKFCNKLILEALTKSIEIK
jgi:hypothetical protein